MASNRVVDKLKKSNIKCEHCAHYNKRLEKSVYQQVTFCGITGDEKEYWNRCKQFEWKE